MLHEPPEVVVVAYGPPPLLAGALEALGEGMHVRIVDNGRSDVVASLARRHRVDYVRPPTNLGFAAAVNVGLRRCTPGRDVLLLNPDARLSGSDLFVLQAELHRGPARCAAVAPRLGRPDGTTEQTCWPMPTPLLPWRGVLGRAGVRAGGGFFLSGAVLLLSGRALAEVGAFDERFFLYAEETDWQRRACARGWQVREVSSVLAEHLGGATSSDGELRDQLFHTSAQLYILKWYGRPGLLVFRLGSLLAAARRLLFARDAGSRGHAALTCRTYLAKPSAVRPEDAR